MYQTLLYYCLLLNLCNLSLTLSVQPHLGVLCAWWNTHTMAVLHHGLYNFTVFQFYLITVNIILLPSFCKSQYH